MGNVCSWVVLDGERPNAPKSLPGKGLATDILGNPSKRSHLRSRKELSHGAFETKEKVLRKNRNEAQPRKRNTQT